MIPTTYPPSSAGRFTAENQERILMELGKVNVRNFSYGKSFSFRYHFLDNQELGQFREALHPTTDFGELQLIPLSFIVRF